MTTPEITIAFQAPGPHPNGMQATPEGLWILDQETNAIHLVSYTGDVLRELPTASDRGSGITDDGRHLWVASTYSCEILKIDRNTGATLARYPSPGAQVTGSHGLEWLEGKLWAATPPSATIYQIDVVENFTVVHSLPAPGNRPHGIAWPNGELWCVETNLRAICQLDVTSGELLRQIDIPEPHPEPHGMTYWAGFFWYCDAYTASVCRLPYPAN
jgi:streptogramin lyase